MVTRSRRTLTPPPGSEENKCENEKKNNRITENTCSQGPARVLVMLEVKEHS